MKGLTLEDLVVLKTLVSIAQGDREKLSPVEVRHYLLGSKLLERLQGLDLGVYAYELGELPKLKEATLSEMIVIKK